MALPTRPQPGQSFSAPTGARRPAPDPGFEPDAAPPPRRPRLADRPQRSDQVFVPAPQREAPSGPGPSEYEDPAPRPDQVFVPAPETFDSAPSAPQRHDDGGAGVVGDEVRSPRPDRHVGDPAPRAPRLEGEAFSVPRAAPRSDEVPPRGEPVWFEGDVIPVPQPGRPATPPRLPPGPPPVDAPPPIGPPAAPARPPAKSTSRPQARTKAPSPRPRRRSSGPSAADWARVAPVYDVDGPRVRYGVAWFAAVALAVLVSPLTTAAAYAIAAGWAARQVVRAWHSPPLHADLAAGMAAVPIVAAVAGVGPGLFALGALVVVAVFAGIYAPGAGLRGSAGYMAGIGILLQATVPVAIAGGAMVLVRGESPAAALLLFGLASAYEMGDFLVGSGSSNSIEGPLAGAAAVVLGGFPMALLLVEPFDVMGMALLGVVAACCPVGQWIASAVLPRPEADAPALRRIDTLLMLAPMWAVAAGAL